MPLKVVVHKNNVIVQQVYQNQSIDIGLDSKVDIEIENGSEFPNEAAIVTNAAISFSSLEFNNHSAFIEDEEAFFDAAEAFGIELDPNNAPLDDPITVDIPVTISISSKFGAVSIKAQELKTGEWFGDDIFFIVTTGLPSGVVAIGYDLTSERVVRAAAVRHGLKILN